METNVKSKFFIDTANIDEVNQVWDKLAAANVDPRLLAGITTNPNALAKIKCNSLSELELTVYKLTRFLTSIGATNGYVHVQMPRSDMTGTELSSWAKYLLELGDGRTNIMMKVSPYVQTLSSLSDGDQFESIFGIIPINVTGVSDAATALRCFSYPVHFVSVIPGRMEEVGIDVAPHLKSIQARQKSMTYFNYSKRLITGSMRTIGGLRRAIQCGSVPTIGMRVWNEMTVEEYNAFASTWWSYESETPNYLNDIPLTDQRNVDLTKQFFIQMDELGKPMYDEFVNKRCK